MQTSFSLSHLVLISAAYLLALFGVAWVSERGIIPRWIIRHPLTYTLSLGVYASAWALYGTVGLAYQYGSAFSPPTWGCAARSCWPRCCSIQSCASPAPISWRRWPTCSPSASAAPGPVR
ncbi:hypothetical protein SSTU70S_07035 [Stutzerimonas stutzeri]